MSSILFYFTFFMRIKTPSFFLWLSSDHDYMTPILLLISSTGRSTGVLAIHET